MKWKRVSNNHASGRSYLKRFNRNKYMKIAKRIVVLLFVTTLLAIVGVGCNTAHGFGKDMEKAGDKIQDSTK